MSSLSRLILALRLRNQRCSVYCRIRRETTCSSSDSGRLERCTLSYGLEYLEYSAILVTGSTMWTKISGIEWNEEVGGVKNSCGCISRLDRSILVLRIEPCMKGLAVEGIRCHSFVLFSIGKIPIQRYVLPE